MACKDMILNKWLKSGKHLPKPLKTFEQQQEIIRFMNDVYDENPQAELMPGTMIGHVYIIDWFLWFMASRGYTLQKTRAKQQFRKIPGSDK